MVSAPERPAEVARPVATATALAEGRVVLRGAEPISDGLFEQLCSETDLLEFERSAEGDLIITLPAGYFSPDVEAVLLTQLRVWARLVGGRARGPTAGYMLTDVLLLSPDVSWVSAEQDAALGPAAGRPIYWWVCPFFAIEVRSMSQTWNEQYGRMLDWMGYGCEVGLLVDWIDERVAVFKAGEETVVLERPSSLEVDAERMPGLVLDFDEVWGLTRD